MASKKFTEEEMDHLRASPFVLKVNCHIVHFSARFKELFWNALEAGREPWDAVIDLGVDPEILGKNRVNGLKGMIRNEVRAGKGFRDLETFGTFLIDYTDKEARIRQLEQQLAYKDQEIEFLKKIVSLGRGAKAP